MRRRSQDLPAGDTHPIRVLKGHREYVRSVAFSPDGRILVSGSGDGTVRLWDTTTWRSMRTLRVKEGVNGVAFSPDGDVTAVAARDAVTLWDIAKGLRVRSLPQTGGAVTFSPDGKLLAVVGVGDYKVNVWPTSTWQNPRALSSGKVESAAFAPVGTTLAVGCLDEVEIWDTTSWTVRHIIRGHWGTSAFFRQGWAKSVAFSSDGGMLAAATEDGFVRVWDTTSWREVRDFTGTGRPGISSVAFSPSGTFVAAGGMDGNVWEWNVRTGQSIGPLEGHRDWVFCVSFSFDGRLLASGGNDGLVAIWRTAGI
jgi:WD40 repeat protein